MPRLQPIEMERDKISELLFTIHDAEKTDHILSCLQEDDTVLRSNICHQNTLIISCGGLDHFALIFDRWIKAQAQPFLSCKPLDPASTTPPVSTTGNSSDTLAFPRTAGATGSKTSPLRGKTVQNQNKKQKKKIAPQTISSLLPSALTDGNISRHKTNDTEVNATFSERFPRLNESHQSSSVGKIGSGGNMQTPPSATSQWPALGGGGAVKRSTDSAVRVGKVTSGWSSTGIGTGPGGTRGGISGAGAGAGSGVRQQKKKRAVLLSCDTSASQGGNIGASAWSSSTSTSTSTITIQADNPTEENGGVMIDQLPPSLEATPSLSENIPLQTEEVDSLPPPPVLCHQISHSVQSQLDTLGVTVTVTASDTSKIRPTVSEPVTFSEPQIQSVAFADGKSQGNAREGLHPEAQTITETQVQPQSPRSTLDTLSADEPASIEAARRMGEIYGHVILRYHTEYFPLTPCVIFLTKLLSVKYIHVGKDITLLLKDLKKFPSCLLNNARLETFAVSVTSTILPLLQSIGGLVLKALTEILTPIAPNLVRTISVSAKASQVTMMIISQQQNEEEKLLSTSNVEAFIRPFDEDFDNRNEYKTQIEKNIYNERERCYDEFSNLFRQFQEVNRSDLDGSKTNDFWSQLYSRGTKVLNLNDCNYLWFAKIFKEMLLFHGINLPKSSSSSYSSSSLAGGGVLESPSGTPRRNPGDGQYPAAHSSTPGQGGVLHTPTGVTAMFSSSTKQRHLEERLGPGGGGKLSSNRRTGGGGGVSSIHATPSSTSSSRSFNSASRQTSLSNGNLTVTTQRMKNLMDACPDPAAYFTGNQQFFFRFIFVMDSNRLNVILQDVLLTEMLHLLDISLQTYHSLQSRQSSDIAGKAGSTGHGGVGMPPSGNPNFGDDYQNSSTKQNKNTKSIILRILKLRVLGKFQGLLQFSPLWNTSVTGLKDSPLVSSAQTYATERKYLCGNSGIPLSALLHYSGTQSCLSLAVPWVTSYLQMLSWDSTSILNLCKKDLILLLKDSGHHQSQASFALTHSNSNTQYLHCIYFFHTIINSDSFDLKKTGEAAITKNRAWVVFEIQSFLSEYPSLVALYKVFSQTTISDLPSMANFLKVSKLADTIREEEEEEEEEEDAEELLVHNNLRMDDLNTGFSPSFLKYLASDMFHAISLMRQRFIQFQRSEELVCERLIASSTLMTKPTSLRSSSSSATKRQTPTLISSHIGHNSPGSTSSSRGRSPVATNLFIQAATSPPRHVALSSSNQLTSPSHHQFDVMKSPPFPPPPSSPLFASNSSTAKGGGSTPNMFSFTPPQLKQPPSSGTGFMNRMSNDISDEGRTFTSTTLFRRTSLSRSLSVGSATEPDNYPADQQEDVQQKLEMSFWNQHPHLYNICNFVVENVSQACRQRLKERVAELVLQAWACCDVAGSQCLNVTKKEIDYVKTTSALKTAEHDTNNILLKYQTMVEKHTSALFQSMCSETEDYLNECVGEHLLATITPFLAVYSMSEGVKETVIKIAMRQKYSLTKSLYTFFCVYARKKLSEVCSKSVQQQRKIFTEVDNLANTAAPILVTAMEETGKMSASSLNVLLQTLGDKQVTYQALRECIFNVFKPVNVSQTSLCSVQYHYADLSNSEQLRKYPVTDTEKEQLLHLFFSHHVILHLEYVNPLTDVVVQSCDVHRTGFQYFSGYICGMVAKCTLLCGQVAVRVFVTDNDSAVGSSKADVNETTCNGAGTFSWKPQEDCTKELSDIWDISSVLVMIANNVSMLAQVVSWAAEQVKVFGPSCQCSGRMRIDVMKMFTSAISTLFVYDLFLERGHTIPTLVGSAFTPASAVITTALGSNLVTLDNVAQLIGYSLKHSLFTTVFTLLGRMSDYKSSIISFVGRLLVVQSSEAGMELDIDVGVGSWANDPSVRRIIKSDISIELANAIEALIKK